MTESEIEKLRADSEKLLEAIEEFIRLPEVNNIGTGEYRVFCKYMALRSAMHAVHEHLQVKQ